MRFVSKRAKLQIEEEDLNFLMQISRSRTESLSKVQRAKILLAYHRGVSISQVAREMRTNRPRVERTVQKALEYGVHAALRDLPRRGRSPVFLRKPKLGSSLWLVRNPKTWATRLRHGQPKSLLDMFAGIVGKVATPPWVTYREAPYPKFLLVARPSPTRFVTTWNVEIPSSN